MGNSVYKVQPRISGSYRGSMPWCKVSGKWYNPKQIWVKVSGTWRKVYTHFTWTYSWNCGGWSGCSRGDQWNNACSNCGKQTRTCTCKRSPDDVTMAASYCGTKPATSQGCACNCNCDCHCCCD